MFKVEDLSFKYTKNSSPVLKKVDLELNTGKIGILLGPNGSGKTTLFKNILGLLKPDSGRMILDGTDISALSYRERARRIAYVPQHINFGDLTVYDTILTGRLPYFGFRAGKKDHEAVERIISEMGLSSIAYRNATELSGGEIQKTAIARALVQQPNMLVFDEPTGNLDLANEALIIREAKTAAHEKNISILCSLHDINLAMQFGDRLFFIKEGKIRYSCSPGSVTQQIIRDIYNIESIIIQAEGRNILIY